MKSVKIKTTKEVINSLPFYLTYWNVFLRFNFWFIPEVLKLNPIKEIEDVKGFFIYTGFIIAIVLFPISWITFVFLMQYYEIKEWKRNNRVNCFSKKLQSYIETSNLINPNL